MSETKYIPVSELKVGMEIKGYKSYVNDKVIAWKEIVPPKEIK